MTPRVAIIGAGVVGTALFREFAQKGHDVYLLERHGNPCTETSSRNSGVLHAGIYNPQDTLKTRLCIEGNRLYREYAARKGLKFWDCGKLIVGPKTSQSQIHALFNQAQENDVPHCRLLTKGEIRDLEPEIAGDVGLLSTTSALIDPHQLTDALLQDGHSSGGTTVFHCDVTGIDPKGESYIIHTNRDDIEVDLVINSAGLEAPRIANWVGLNKYRYHYCRGDYFAIQGGHFNIRHLIYPTPDTQHHALGVHITPDENGRIRLGPDATYIDSHLNLKDTAQHKHSIFYESAKQLLPRLKPEQMTYDMCGIRPKLKPPHCNEFYDFVIEEYPTRIIHLIGIESPGLTASLAIARCVCNQHVQL